MPAREDELHDYPPPLPPTPAACSLEGLTKLELESLADWERTFESKYEVVGRVSVFLSSQVFLHDVVSRLQLFMVSAPDSMSKVCFSLMLESALLCWLCGM